MSPLSSHAMQPWPFRVTAETAGVVSIFERHLKEANPTVVNITYDLKDLLRFLDQLVGTSQSFTVHKMLFPHLLTCMLCHIRAC